MIECLVIPSLYIYTQGQKAPFTKLCEPCQGQAAGRSEGKYISERLGSKEQASAGTFVEKMMKRFNLYLQFLRFDLIWLHLNTFEGDKFWGRMSFPDFIPTDGPVLVLEKATEDLVDFLAENINRRHNSLSFTWFYIDLIDLPITNLATEAPSLWTKLGLTIAGIQLD